MNERIKELAEQAGWSGVYSHWISPTTREYLTVPCTEEQIERFAELIRLDETKACAKHYLEIMRDAVEQAVLKERDKCAQDYLQDCADAVEAARLDEREQISHTYLKLTVEAVLREREACSDLIANMISGIEGVRYAEAIRQRGEK